MTMDVEVNPSLGEAFNGANQNMATEPRINNIISSLTSNQDIIFKSQQRGEADLTIAEKSEVALEIYDSSKFNFLSRFGKHLSLEHLKFFEQFASNSEEIALILKDLLHNKISHNVDVKNRRYEALKQMIQEGSYFSDVEMMKRNPLLYEQLVGQYLTDEEKKERDKAKMYEEKTFVRILMEGIERDNAEVKRQQQAEFEDNAMEEDDDDDSDEDMDGRKTPEPTSYSRWGEYHDEVEEIVIKKTPKKAVKVEMITAEERELLREEFTTSMYQSFLDGKDEDFDYTTVDENEKYDSKDTVDHDEEDKYFDAEEPEDVNDQDQNNTQENSEDELDVYMSALNNHPAITKLSDDMKRL